MKLIDHAGLREKGIKYSRTQIWRLVRAGLFPAPVEVGPQRRAWVEEEVDAYLEARVAERDAKLAGGEAA